MIRKILGTLAVSSLLAAGANATTLTFMGPTDTIEPGQSFDVTVMASGFTDGLFGGSLWIDYDTSLVSLNSITLNTFLSNPAGSPPGFFYLSEGFSCTTALEPITGNGGCANPPDAGAFDVDAEAYVLMAGAIDDPDGNFLSGPFNTDGTMGLLFTMNFTALGGVAEAIATITGYVASLGGGFLNSLPPGENVIPAESITINPASVNVNTAVIPLPAAVWFMLGGVASLLGFRRK